MFKFVTKVADKLYIPILLLNMAAIGAMFYNHGKADAITEMNAVKIEEF
jgi:hypothetical protein